MMIKIQISGDDQPVLVTPEVYAAAVFGKVSHTNFGPIFEEGEAPVYPPADAHILDTAEVPVIEASPENETHFEEVP